MNSASPLAFAPDTSIGPVPPAPALRVRTFNAQPVRPDRACMLYWMVAQRRTAHNFGLQHAVARAFELGRPLVVLEALRVDHPWASPRLHHFVVEGMVDNAAACAAAGVAYHPYVEPEVGHGRGLLAALAAQACLVVTDEFPSFFLPRMVAAAAAHLDVRVETVDGNGIMPLRAADRAFTTAASFRRHLHKTLPAHLGTFPVPAPLAHAARLGHATIPAAVQARWPAPDLRHAHAGWIDGLPLAHAVPRVVEATGGSSAAEARLAKFLEARLGRYHTDRNQVQGSAASGLSAHLHFGHIGVHAIVSAVFEREAWQPNRLAATPTGSREGWWGLSPAAESFLDELITWREVGYTFAFQRPDDYDRFESLPEWALATLTRHAADERAFRYTFEELDAGHTHDALWNAAQAELRITGRIHNYLRMLWGKKILEWTASPQEALAVMIALNDRYALDGRNPNSYSGIFWILGRFDRAWGPERPIFGTVRYMSSDNTRRKLDVAAYLRRFGGIERATLPLFTA